MTSSWSSVPKPSQADIAQDEEAEEESEVSADGEICIGRVVDEDEDDASPVLYIHGIQVGLHLLRAADHRTKVQ